MWCELLNDCFIAVLAWFREAGEYALVYGVRCVCGLASMLYASECVCEMAFDVTCIIIAHTV